MDIYQYINEWRRKTVSNTTHKNFLITVPDIDLVRPYDAELCEILSYVKLSGTLVKKLTLEGA